MATVKCTTRLLNELGVKPMLIPSQPTSLSHWHANLLRIGQKKCVLFTNDQTLYSFLILIVKKPSLTEFGHLFRLGLLKSLMAEGLDDPHVARRLAGNGAIEITKTSSRSVLGSMNDLALHVKYIIPAMGRLANANLSEIGRELNRIPMSAIKYNVAIEELKQKLAAP